MEINMELPVNYNNLHYRKRRAVREAYVKVQDGFCCHCKAPLKSSPAMDIAEKPVDASLFPEGFFNWPVHLHHCHETGMTIGATHAHCNAVLWQYYGI